MVEEIKQNILSMIQKMPEGLTTRGLLKKLGVKDKQAFDQALSQLKQQGLISVSRTHQIRSVRQKLEYSAVKPTAVHKVKLEPAKRPGGLEKKDLKKATIISLSRNFAFARPEDGGDDMFIHGSNLKSAFIGDAVLLSNVQQSEKGFSADVDEVTEKSSRTLTGTVVRNREVYEMTPDDAIRYNIPIDRKSGMTANDGDKVQAKISRIPNTDRLIASIVHVYGKASCAKICADAIIDRNEIRKEFPEEVIAEAMRVSKQKITDKDLKDRLDLRDTNICTIDSESAKDLDDAVSVSRTRLGFRLGVHIADVSNYVKEGSAIDLEAQQRGTSVYFADRVIPMLPEELSNGVCSLNAGEDKLTFSAIIDLDKQGSILSYQFHKSVINSKVRGVYSEVNKLFDGTADQALRKKYANVIRSLNAAKELAGILKDRSKSQGTVDLDSTESKFVLDENGICIDVLPRQTGESEQMIEQLMITANQAAAKLAKAMKLPFVYRVHELPNPDRVDSLAELVSALGLNAKSLKHSADIKTSDFAQIMEQAAGTPTQKVISHQLLRTMAKARYDTQPIGHFGLALEDYCHFTSPIRRYPDTAIHRILSAYLKKDKNIAEHFTDYAQYAASNSSKCEVRAMMAERSAEDCYMAEYMTQHIGECYEGIISGVTMRGVFVELPNSVEGFVPSDTFKDAKFKFDGMITQVDENTGKKLTIGQSLMVKSVSADVASGRIDFIPVEE